MNTALLPLIIALPLAAAALSVLLRAHPRATGTILLSVSALVLGAGAALLSSTLQHGPVAHGVGLWPSGIAIPLVVDPFSALLMTVTALLILLTAVFAVALRDTRHPLFATLVLVLLAGVQGVLLTGDLFNLYVFLELILMPSYALLALLGSRRDFRATRLLVIVNVFASLVLLLGVALVYGTAGTVNLAELSGRAQEDPAVAVAGAVVLIALGFKASVVPMHGWLAQTYPFTSPSVAALFSVLHTKVAVYAIYRIYAVVYHGDGAYLGLILVLMVVTMVVGALAALAAPTMRAVLSWQVVSHIGYILLGVGLFGPLGLAAGIFYLVHNMVVKGALFLSAGAIEEGYGTGRLDRLGGLVRTETLVALAFVAAGLSLSGLPPFSGFAAKLLLVDAAVDTGQPVVAAAVVGVSVLSLLAMMRIWNAVFWGRSRDRPQVVERRGMHARTRVRWGTALPAVALALVSLALGLGAQGLVAASMTAAEHLLDPTRYVEVLANG